MSERLIRRGGNHSLVMQTDLHHFNQTTKKTAPKRTP